MNSEYTMYIPRIGYTWDIHGYTMYIHVVYTCYIQGYTWNIIDVYTWYIHCISMDNLGFSKRSETRFRGKPVLLVSFNMHTCVGDQEKFIPRTTMALVPGEKAATKAQPNCRQP